MSGGQVYYAQRKLFPKFWQRHLAGAAFCTVAMSIAYWYQQLAYQRYNGMKGRSALYGTDRQNGGKYRHELTEE